jgi:hypothetical protein
LLVICGGAKASPVFLTRDTWGFEGAHPDT